MMWAPSDSLIGRECDLEQPVIDKWQHLLSSALTVIDVNIHAVYVCVHLRDRGREKMFWMLTTRGSAESLRASPLFTSFLFFLEAGCVRDTGAQTPNSW